MTALGVLNLTLALIAAPDGILLLMGIRPPFTVPVETWSLFTNFLNYIFVGVFFLLLWAEKRFQLGFGRLFALYVAAYTVGRAWVEALRVDPANVAAVEDSHNGILAARAAGMCVLAIPNAHFPPGLDALDEADKVLNELADLTVETVEATCRR